MPPENFDCQTIAAPPSPCSQGCVSAWNACMDTKVAMQHQANLKTPGLWVRFVVPTMVVGVALGFFIGRSGGKRKQ